MGSTKISSPPPPNYGESMREVLTSQVELMPRVFQSEQQFQPQFAQLEADIQQYMTQRGMDELKRLYPQIADIEEQYTQKTTQAELERLKQQLPEYKSTFEALTPGYGEAIGNIGQLAKQASEQALQRGAVKDYLSSVQGPTSGQFVGQIEQYRPGAAISAVEGPSETGYMGRVGDISATSGLERISEPLVNQYVRTMPGMEQYAQTLAQRAQEEVAAGRSLTPEEERMAQQAAREAYAARGTALGPQSAAAEVLQRADVANQRLAQRMALGQQAAGQVQSIYAPALQQALQRQQIGAEYGLSAQGQRFSQAQARENLAQQIQQQRYAQAMGREQLAGSAQAQAFGQAMGREELAAATQQQQFAQAAQRQGIDLEKEQALNQLQAQRAQLAAGALGQLQASQAPILSAFYKQPLMLGSPMALQAFGMQGVGAMGPQFFNPESPTGMGSIYGAYNSEQQRRAGEAQARAGRSSGLMSMGGSIAGAGIVGGAILF